MSQVPRAEDWTSYSYWTNSSASVAQHWYNSFCLMMSSAQDWLTGVALLEAKNLNWAATASYYSTVHCGRLLCFIACGDFPTQHAKLRQLFASQGPRAQRSAPPTGENAGPRDDDGYRFDWLRKFLSASHDEEHTPNRHPLGAIIQTKLRALAPQLLQDMDELCPKFAALGALRNESNYESLLIAHEFHHRLVSTQFERLADRASIIAERSARLAKDMFLEYVNRDERLQSERRAYRAATSVYFFDRLYPAIASKVAHSATATQKLKEFMNMGTAIDHNRCMDVDWTTIEDHISMEVFHSKTCLMRGFEAKVQAL